MEKDTLFSSNTPSILREKFYDCSDGFNLMCCRKCGLRAEFNSS